MELLAYRSYRELDFQLRFWWTKSEFECDFVLARDRAVAIEVKWGSRLRPSDLGVYAPPRTSIAHVTPLSCATSAVTG